MSPTEASFDLRERYPLSRNILHSWELIAPTTTGQRTNQRLEPFAEGYRDRVTDLPVSAGHLNYPADVRDTAKSGMGRAGNRHLHYLVEFISVNVGGSGRNVKERSPLRTGLSVGGSIVLGARESRVQGEGSQGVNASRVESKHEPEESRTRRKVTR